MVYTGPIKVDHGYLRPQILDLTATASSGTVVDWDGTGAKPIITGPGLLLGTAGTSVAGQSWTKTTAGTNNTDWVAV